MVTRRSSLIAGGDTGRTGSGTDSKGRVGDMSKSQFKKMAAPQPQIDPGCIDVTTDYDVFQRMPGNRAVSENHVQKLMNAMREHDLMVPILINQDFEVIDGQHRLEARKRLGIPVPYYWEQGLSLVHVQALNCSQKGWSNEDFADAYIELKNQNYIQYKWFRRKYGIPHSPSCILLLGYQPHDMINIFRSGQFKVKDLETAKARAELLSGLAPLFSHWKDAAFVKAFLIVLNRQGFDYKTFTHRLKQNPTMMKHCTNIDTYLQQIEEVYNYRSPKKVPLRYGEDNPKAA